MPSYARAALAGLTLALALALAFMLGLPPPPALVLPLLVPFPSVAIPPLRATATATATAASAPPLPGSPPNVDLAADCTIRKAAWEFGRKLLPGRGQFKSLHDALALGGCGKDAQLPRNTKDDAWVPPRARRVLLEESASVLYLFVDGRRGKDAHSGTKDAPLRTIAEALTRVGKARASKSQIIIREGVYTVQPNAPLTLTALHNGLTMRNAPGERVTISGAEYRDIAVGDWKRTAHRKDPDVSTFMLATHLPPFDGLRMNRKRMVTAKSPNGAPELSQHSFKYWTSATSATTSTHNGTYTHGWFPTIPSEVRWQPSSPRPTPLEEDDDGGAAVEVVESSPKDWPDVLWTKFTPPPAPPGNVFDPINGAGARGSFLVGVKGRCNQALSPPVGYFCAVDSPRGGSTLTFRAPRGMFMRANAVRLNKGALVVAWRGNPSPGTPQPQDTRAFAWTWRVASWKAHSEGEVEIVFESAQTGKPSTTVYPGGSQGAPGSDVGDFFYIENIFSGLDDPGEYFYDDKLGELFVVLNGTSMMDDGSATTTTPTPAAGEFPKKKTIEWGFVRAKELVKIVGTQTKPVKGIALVGLEFRDTARTWLDPHSAPSGGDYTLPKSAAVASLGGVENLLISNCLFERLDGSGILLSGYARGVEITHNEFAWLGASAIVSWGHTSPCLNAACTRQVPLSGDGPDGRTGEQPRGTRVGSNLFRELGVFVKQSTAYLSALSGRATLESNVFVNSPRSFITFNDGFLGGDVVRGNLFVNPVRESGEHGAITMWDRVPYIWESTEHFVRGTTIPQVRTLERNFVLATFASSAAVNADDGASYLQTRFNVFAYGSVGLKSQFGGHDHSSIGDVYLFVQSHCFVPVPKAARVPLFGLAFQNNTCVVAGSNPFAYGSRCDASGTPAGGMVAVAKNRVVGRVPLRVCGDRLLRDHLKGEPKLDPFTVELAGFPSNDQIRAWIRDAIAL